MQLKPLKQVKNFKVDFWTFDLETESLRGVNFKVGALYQSERLPRERIQLFRTVEEIFIFLEEFVSNHNWKKAGKYKNIFIHNLTFDIRFILEYIATHEVDCEIVHLASGSKDLVVELKIQGFRFRFIDSYQ